MLNELEAVLDCALRTEDSAETWLETEPDSVERLSPTNEMAVLVDALIWLADAYTPLSDELIWLAD